MKKLVYSLALAIAGTFAFGQNTEEAQPTENPNSPKIEFETKVIDYGTIEKGANGKREFKFTNTGKEPLIITKAVGSCGCTVPSWPREPIAPNGTAVIEVRYDTKRVGPFAKSVTINSNAANGVQRLKIKGKVENKPQPKTTPENENKSSVLQQG